LVINNIILPLSPPKRTAFRQVPSQRAAHLEMTISHTVGCGDAGLEPGTLGQQSGALTTESPHLPLFSTHNNLMITVP
jgi:hypothetical protein